MLRKGRPRVALLLRKASGNGVKHSGMGYQHKEPPDPQSLNSLGLHQIGCDV